MPLFTESNITLNFPDAQHFRFADCVGYQQLSGNHFKEMDYAWYDGDKNIYWLFELKDFSQARLNAETTMEQRAWALVKKSVDSLCMLLAAKHDYRSVDIAACLPQKPDANTQFKFVSVIHCGATQKADISLLHEQFRQKFKPYADLFGITHYAVLEHSQAIRKIPNNLVKEITP